MQHHTRLCERSGGSGPDARPVKQDDAVPFTKAIDLPAQQTGNSSLSGQPPQFKQKFYFVFIQHRQFRGRAGQTFSQKSEKYGQIARLHKPSDIFCAVFL